MSIDAVSAASAVHQQTQANQPKTAQPAQSTQQQPKHDTVHLSSAATGDVDHDHDSH